MKSLLMTICLLLRKIGINDRGEGDNYMQNIIVEQIRDYTALAVRHSELVSASGSRWRPEYAAELEKITKELSDMKKEMFGEEKV